MLLLYEEAMAAFSPQPDIKMGDPKWHTQQQKRWSEQLYQTNNLTYFCSLLHEISILAHCFSLMFSTAERNVIAVTRGPSVYIIGILDKRKYYVLLLDR